MIGSLISATGTLEWAWPWLIALLPLPWLLGLIWPRKEMESKALHLSFANDLSAFTTHQSTSSKRCAPLWWLAWLLVLMAACNPQWVGEAISVPDEGRDLMLAVDASGSMREMDMNIGGQRLNRLQAVQVVASDFIRRREQDRVGLILFGDNAYLQSPLSFDRETVAQLLNEAVIGIAGQRRTAVGDAIGLALKRVRQKQKDDENKKPPLLILLTDGESNAGLDPLKAAELAATHGMKIYTIGFGSNRIFGGAEFDERVLDEIAKKTGGRYFRAKNTAELAKIYELVDQLEPVEDDARQFRPITQLGHWPLLAACLVMLLSGLLSFLPMLSGGRK
ncbi:MAG: Ca-activated chloride channel family protein [Gammaproteobacteria bacterium]|jgi:Ca-activated chloride channel family protein